MTPFETTEKKKNFVNVKHFLDNECANTGNVGNQIKTDLPKTSLFLYQNFYDKSIIIVWSIMETPTMFLGLLYFRWHIICAAPLDFSV